MCVLCVRLSVCVCMFVCVFDVCLYVFCFLRVCLCVCVFACVFDWLRVCVFVCLSVSVFLCVVWFV